MKAALAHLETVFGDSCSSERRRRAQVAGDASGMAETLPDLVIWPETTEDVLVIVETCRQGRVPLTVRGGGTSLAGNPIPVRGGVVIDTSRMDAIVVREADLMAVVQPGVTAAALDEALAARGLWLPVSPGVVAERATIGGMVANNAAGPTSLKYGATRDHVLGMSAVTGAGELIRVGHQCRKSSSGYDLTSLIVGSEGTLAVVCEVALAIRPRPSEIRRLAFSLPDEGAAATASLVLGRSSLNLGACEYLDATCIAALNAAKQCHVLERPTLFLELHGQSAVEAESGVAATQRLMSQLGGTPFSGADDPWELRRGLGEALRRRYPGAVPVWRDLAFPVGLLPEVVQHAHELARAKDLQLAMFGQSVMGILYVVAFEPPDQPERWESADELGEEMVQFVVDRGGSCSALSGVGMGNRGFMRREHGLAVRVMQRIKNAMDPEGILNPGKLLP